MTAPLMLGVSGLRGIAGESLTHDVAARYAQAFARWLMNRNHGRAKTIVASRDGRAGGDRFLATAIGAMTDVGANVIDIGIATTPTTAVAVDATHADGAIIITASHNPQPWNGLKCLVRLTSTGDQSNATSSRAHAPALADANAIIEHYHASDMPSTPSRRGDVTYDPTAVDRHVARVITAIADLPPPRPGCAPAELAEGMTIALDSVESSGGPAGLALLESLGCDEVLHLGGGMSGVFPHTPEPTRENLTSLCEAVRGAGASIGFAQDPDADRLAIIDERGEYIGEEYTLVLATMALLEAGAIADGGVLCANLSTSRMIDDLAARHDARIIRTPVGEAHVAQAIAKSSAAIGGEGNGGVIWPAVTLVRDSLSAMALVLWLMARRQRPLSSIIADIPAYAIVKYKIDLPQRAAATTAINAIGSHFAAQTTAAVGVAPGSGSPTFDRQDGLRIDLPAKRAWLHVRPSNTEPIMRLIAEAPTETIAIGLIHEAHAATRTT